MRLFRALGSGQKQDNTGWTWDSSPEADDRQALQVSRRRLKATVSVVAMAERMVLRHKSRVLQPKPEPAGCRARAAFCIPS